MQDEIDGAPRARATAPTTASATSSAGASTDAGAAAGAADAPAGAADAPATLPATAVTVYTDGACRGNPGPGGWGVLLVHGGREKELWGGEKQTTNNRMELLAAIRALESLNRRCRVALYTDSQYVRNGIREWLPNWKRRGWKTADKKPVKNQDLWERLDALAAAHEVEWHWVRGHAGHDGNERADALANRGIDELGRG